ncbi:MAG: IS21 family transposase [Actinomycetota bacterium]|nr:IS21 family transposase [Actinomycetota bacterium]
MERSAIYLLAKRGKSQRQIARELGYSRATVARVLHEPVEKAPARRTRSSLVDPYRPQIEQWVREGLTAVRRRELARADPVQPYRGGRSVFNEAVRRIRLAQQQATADVPVRFEGLPAEYLQVDWGEIRRFPFTQQLPHTRYFLACRLKYSRWSWVRFTENMRQETLVRGLVACFGALGWVPWVLVFDNMKTVTTGRDAAGEPIWHPALLQLAHEFGFHPEACAIGAGNQKGSVESLVKWVQGNFLAGRSFVDDTDLAQQAAEWVAEANQRPSSATGDPPVLRLAAEAQRGGALPPTAHDYGLLLTSRVTRESLVPVEGNAYSVPLGHVGAPVTVRLHCERVVIWRDTVCLTEHRRAPAGAQRRVIEPAHFTALFGRKPRAQVMLYRQALLDLGEPATSYLTEVSCRRRDRLRTEVLSIYAAWQQQGTAALLAAMTAAAQAGAYGAEYLATLLWTRDTVPAAVDAGRLLPLPGVPAQAEIDRRLSDYEVYVEGGGATDAGDAREVVG